MTTNLAAWRLGFEMKLDGAVEFADRGGEYAALCHQGAQSREHVLARRRIIDAQHAPVRNLSMRVKRGPDLRLPWSQWLWQDHNHPHAVRPAHPRRGPRHLPRLRQNLCP